MRMCAVLFAERPLANIGDSVLLVSEFRRDSQNQDHCIVPDNTGRWLFCARQEPPGLRLHLRDRREIMIGKREAMRCELLSFPRRAASAAGDGSPVFRISGNARACGSTRAVAAQSRTGVPFQSAATSAACSLAP